MKNIATLIAIVFICSFGFSQSGPKIEFKIKDNTLDYGTVNKKKDNGVRFIEFTNTGDAALIITSVYSTSGFTFPSTPTEPIMPGKTDRIEMKYNMSPGPIRKTITVETNAVNYEGGRAALKIKGEVIAD